MEGNDGFLQVFNTFWVTDHLYAVRRVSAQTSWFDFDEAIPLLFFFFFFFCLHTSKPDDDQANFHVFYQDSLSGLQPWVFSHTSLHFFFPLALHFYIFMNVKSKSCYSTQQTILQRSFQNYCSLCSVHYHNNISYDCVELTLFWTHFSDLKTCFLWVGFSVTKNGF